MTKIHYTNTASKHMKRKIKNKKSKRLRNLDTQIIKEVYLVKGGNIFMERSRGKKEE